jgi:hypothetical protein
MQLVDVVTPCTQPRTVALKSSRVASLPKHRCGVIRSAMEVKLVQVGWFPRCGHHAAVRLLRRHHERTYSAKVRCRRRQSIGEEVRGVMNGCSG